MNNLEFFTAQLIKGRLRCAELRTSGAELKVAKLLDSLHIPYKSQVLINNKFICGFALSENLIFEVDGDWWHGHRRFEPLRPQQVAQQKKDRSKEAYLHACGYTVVRIWESDISLENIISKLRDYVAIEIPCSTDS